MIRRRVFRNLMESKVQSKNCKIDNDRVRGVGLIIFDVGSHKGESISQICDVIFDPKIMPKVAGDEIEYDKTDDSNFMKFHSFEPNKENVDSIHDVCKDIIGVDCIINEVAVSNKKGVVEFNISRSDTSSIEHYNEKIFKHPSKVEKYKPSKTIEVTTTTLDDYVKEFSIDHIDFLKIDVENHEDKVLEGTQTLLKNGKIEFIEIEYHGDGNHWKREVEVYDIEKYLIPNGYELIDNQKSDTLRHWTYQYKATTTCV